MSDILTIAAGDIQPAPELVREAETGFVDGIAVLSERVVTILSMERMIASLVGATAEAA